MGEGEGRVVGRQGIGARRMSGLDALCGAWLPAHTHPAARHLHRTPDTAKYTIAPTGSFWRPITAIRQGDGVPADLPYVDATWTPLLKTPAHPEHPSGERLFSRRQPGQPRRLFTACRRRHAVAQPCRQDGGRPPSPARLTGHSATAGSMGAVIAQWVPDTAFTIGSEYEPKLVRDGGTWAAGQRLAGVAARHGAWMQHCASRRPPSPQLPPSPCLPACRPTAASPTSRQLWRR